MIDLDKPQWSIRTRESALHRSEALSQLLSAFAAMDRYTFIDCCNAAAHRSRMGWRKAQSCTTDHDLACDLLSRDPLFRQIAFFNRGGDHQLDIVLQPILARGGAGLRWQQRRQRPSMSVCAQPAIQSRAVFPNFSRPYGDGRVPTYRLSTAVLALESTRRAICQSRSGMLCRSAPDTTSGSAAVMAG